MIWPADMLLSSIGKKLLMAATGLAFCMFLSVHLVGNLTLYGGQGSFNAYAEQLHRLGVLLALAEWCLAAMASVHVCIGATLFLNNLRARPSRYKVNRRAGGRTVGSATMPYTGLLLVTFVIYHLLGFHFVDKTDRTIYQIVADAFRDPATVVMYTGAMVLAAVHVSHGLWSAFHTIGADHPKYTPIVRGMSILFCLVVGIGFGSIPVYMFVAQ